jgi:hypothetical protein
MKNNAKYPPLLPLSPRSIHITSTILFTVLRVRHFVRLYQTYFPHNIKAYYVNCFRTRRKLWLINRNKWAENWNSSEKWVFPRISFDAKWCHFF